MIEALVLGTYHMANPKADLVKTEIRPTLSPDRQKEIAEVVERLIDYSPSKIMVEAVPPAETLSAKYQAYLNGNHELGRDEREQIGFRVGKELRITELIPVDEPGNMDFDGVFAFAEQNGNAAFLKWAEDAQKAVGKILSDLDRDCSVKEILRYMNSPEGLWESHSFYMRFLDADQNGMFPGADLVAGWYQRNLRIFSNIRKEAEDGDRILILYGAGHAKLLSDFICDSDGWDLADPISILGS